MIVLGIHLSHDASAALVVDGRIVAAASEERFRRVKMFCGFPREAIAAVLAAGGVEPRQVHRVAVPTKEIFRSVGWREIKRRMAPDEEAVRERRRMLVDRVTRYFLGRAPDTETEERKGREIFLEALQRDYGIPPDRVGYYDHHTCHAASALYPSPFGEALVLTVDGRGDGLSATAHDGQGYDLRRLASVSDMHSVGMFYAAVTCFLGFRPNRHEGKVTGLAARGDAERLHGAFRKLFEVDGGARTIRLHLREEPLPASAEEVGRAMGALSLRLRDRINLMAQSDVDAMMYAVNYHSMLAYLDRVAADARPEDVAAATQRVTEEVVTELAAALLPKGRAVPLALAGGVFANVRVNQKLRELPGVANVYVQPAMGDDGISLGAALLAARAELVSARGERPCAMPDAYLGPSFSSDAIESACRAEGVSFTRSRAIHRDIAEWVHQGLLVGRFHGRMEWGPRALGHRSILIRPTDARINDTVNQRLQRTEFMPFAPSMLEEVAADYLEGWRADHVAARYMTATYAVTPARRASIEAVVHVDGTARPQVVNPQQCPDFHAILTAYREISGLGVVVNTSFNMHEEPIVHSPRDALRSLARGCVDVLAMEDYVVRREG